MSGEGNGTSHCSLEEHIDIESSPVGVEIEGALNPRIVGSGHIALVILPYDLSVTVAVHILYVARSHSIALRTCAVLHIGPACEQSVSKEAPSASHLFAGEFLIHRSIGRVARVVEPAAVCVGEHKLCAVVEVSYVIVVADGEVKSAIVLLVVVAIGVVVPSPRWRIGTGHTRKDVILVFVEDIEFESEQSFPGFEINTDVVAVNLRPGKVRIAEHGCIDHSLINPAEHKGLLRKAKQVEVVGTSQSVGSGGLSCAGAELELIHPRRVKPVLLVDVPTQGDTRENYPAGAGLVGENVGSVIAAREFQEVLLCVGVVEASCKADGAAVAAPACNGRNLFGAVSGLVGHLVQLSQAEEVETVAGSAYCMTLNLAGFNESKRLDGVLPELALIVCAEVGGNGIAVVRRLRQVGAGAARIRNHIVLQLRRSYRREHFGRGLVRHCQPSGVLEEHII